MYGQALTESHACQKKAVHTTLSLKAGNTKSVQEKFIMSITSKIWIYHIVHMDRLPSIIADNALLCDSEVEKIHSKGTCIGLSNIKQRRRNELILNSHKNLHVGDCVPFYFCPRSVMLYLIHKKNLELTYQGGQEPIVHLVADLYDTVDFAHENNKRWAFTTSNAGSRYFEDYADLRQLDKIDWDAVAAPSWSACKEAKQAEFLLEQNFPWPLIRAIGVYSERIERNVALALNKAEHKPALKVMPQWYY
jgi:hypothetical protein